MRVYRAFDTATIGWSLKVLRQTRLRMKPSGTVPTEAHPHGKALDFSAKGHLSRVRELVAWQRDSGQSVMPPVTGTAVIVVPFIVVCQVP